MEWYYAVGNERKGAVSTETLVGMVRSGVIPESTLVWRDGMAGWQPYSVTIGPDGAAVDISGFPMDATGRKYCTQCGLPFDASQMVQIGQLVVCASCKPLALQKIREGSAAAMGQPYAGFWIRLAAYFIDSVLVGMVTTVLGLILMSPVLMQPDSEKVGMALGLLGLNYVVNFAILISYEAWFLVNKGATIGKSACGLKVIRPSGEKITYAVAIGRYFGKMLSGVILGIGYLMIVWDEEKRALHDRISETRVVKA